jgi:hypothetical protein
MFFSEINHEIFSVMNVPKSGIETTKSGIETTKFLVIMPS